MQRNAISTRATSVSSIANRPAFWLATLALLIHLPLAASIVRLHGDTVEYVDIARHLLAGDGFVLGVKAVHFRGTEVLHDGLNERPPLLPFIAAALFAAGFGLPSLQLFNAVVTAGSVALVYGIGAALLSRRVGILAGLLAATNPMVARHLLPPMTEALSIFWVLLAIWLVVRCQDSPRSVPCLLAGGALGLGYLTRPTGAALVVALLFGVVLMTPNRRRLIRPVAASMLGVAMFAIPVTLSSWSAHGPSLSYSGGTYHFSIREITDLNEHYGRSVPTPTQFVLANFEFVVKAVISNIKAYGRTLFLDRNMLLLFLVAWPAVLYSLLRGRYPAGVWLVLLVAATNFFTYALVWSTFAGRYQVMTLLLLLPLAVDGLSRLGLGRLRLGSVPGITALHLAVFAIILVWSPALAQQYREYLWPNPQSTEIRSYQGLAWLGEDGWAGAHDPEVMDWIKASTDRRAVLTHHNPWLFTLFTERPAVRLPREMDIRKLKRFLVDYRVDYFLLRRGDPDWRANEGILVALESEGVYVKATAGRYRVFDTRPIWQ